MASSRTHSASLEASHSATAGLDERERQDMRLTRRLRLLVIMMVLTAVPLGIALAILPNRIQTILTQQGEQHLSQIAHDLAMLTQRTMELHLQTVQILGSLPELRQALRAQAQGTLDPEQLTFLNGRLASLVSDMSTELQGIYLCNAEGLVFAGVLQNGDPDPYRDLRIEDRTYYKEAVRTRKPVISDPIVSKISGMPVVAVVAPILDDRGAFVGLLGMTIRIEHLSRLISGEKIGLTGYPFAIDRHGVMVSHPNPERYLSTGLINRPGSQRLMTRMMGGETGIEPYLSASGARKLAAFSPAPICGWSIAASMEMQEYEAPVREIRSILSVLLVACLLTGLVIACTLLIGLRRLNRALHDGRISDRKIAEQAALLEKIRDGIIVWNLDDRVQFWNRGALEMFGWSASEAMGKAHRELMAAEHAPYGEASELVRKMGTWRGHLRQRTKDGKLLTVDSRWTLLRDEKDAPRAVVAVCTDITEQLILEEKLIRGQRLESLGTLAGGIAHDLNNLLTPILMGTNLAQAEPLSPSQAETIGIIEQSARQGAQLVRQILAFAKGVKGSIVSVHVGFVIKEIITITLSTFPKKIQVRSDVPDDIALIKGDPSQLSQVLLNLLVNARDAMPEGGTITIRAYNQFVDEAVATLHPELKPGPHVCIETIDTGTGIPREVLPRIFEPFFSTKEPGKGTGLGLSTVLGIIKGMHGTITVYSEPGKGSSFKVYLPTNPDAEGAESLLDAVAPPSQGRGELILLVDDEASIRDVALRVLESNGYKVLTATNGKDALSLYNEHHSQLALVITDMLMPAMDGESLALEISRGPNPVPVLGMSGLNDPTLRKTQQSGGLQILAKPFSIIGLLEAVAGKIRQAHT